MRDTMKTKLPSFEAIEELKRWHVPVDRYVLKQVQDAHQSLRIIQIENAPANQLLASPSGEVSVMIELAVVNNTSRNVYLVRAHLDIPLYDGEIVWLPRPVPGCGESEYVVPGSDPEMSFPDREVLNGLFGSHSPIVAGDSVNRLLLGSSPVPLPARYKERERVLAELTLYSTDGKRCSTTVKLTVLRADLGPKTRSTRRVPLFEAKDAQLV